MIEQLLRNHYHLPALSLHLFDSQGLTSTPLRQELRVKILSLLEERNPNLSVEDRARALDLSQPLHQVGSTYISISHTRDCQGILFSPVPCGLDIEETSRVRPLVVARVSTPSEMEDAPSAAYLWAAKEAVYKALSPFNGPAVLSQIEIGDWNVQDDESRVGIFRMNNLRDFSSLHGVGCLISNKGYAISTFLLLP